MKKSKPNYVFCGNRVDCAHLLTHRDMFRRHDVLSDIEFQRMPDEQVGFVKDFVDAHIKSGRPYLVLTCSPYVLNALETYTCEYGQTLICLDRDAKTIELEQAYAKFYKPFADLMNVGRA